MTAQASDEATEAPFRCSVAARERGDQLVGTAVPAPRWMLVAHPGPWAPSAIGTAPLTEVAGELEAALAPFEARLQLIRRHGRHDDEPGVGEGDLPVFLVDATTGRVGRATWREPADLVALAGRFDDLPDVCHDPMVLVCAHGKKDVCCAISGRLVTRVLDDVLPGLVWETTHLGGDRFAGNAVVLPEGSMYGRLEGTGAPQVVVDHLDGQVSLEHWRGRSVWSAPAQVVVHDLLGRDGSLRLDDVTFAEAVHLDPDRWRVTVVARGEEHAREVTRTMLEARRLTCGAAEKKSARYDLV